ncbi:MAG: Hybrid sensor histidine kinase [Limisphaerales bacterium]|nr:MAG: Hybrid sensor histidine kinase [Limisphaerales bacterium]TXT49078.1 MAG: Hybrid sensor histidine kinase [Limisphaerales bacterium]
MNPPTPAAPATTTSRPITVLLIEDDRAVREPIKQFLERSNYRVLTAENAEEALLLWTGYRSAIGAVVSDCDLGTGPTGLSVLREIHRSTPALPLILASGSLTPDLVIELERTTAIKCLPKPFSLAELLALLPPKA